MGFTQAVGSCLRGYVRFSGRAARSEFWWFALFDLLCSLVAGFLDALVYTNIFGLLVDVLLVLPGLAVSVRRLHDDGRTGWWVLLSIVPVIGWIILLIWYVRRGTIGDNRFGPDPLDISLEAT
jgi:uncharacterized membrane protein YhaH (DUF805 family)